MPRTPLQEWAHSGAMALTGHPDGPPLAAPGTPASSVVAALDRVRAAARTLSGTEPNLPDSRLLGERAAYLGLARRAPFSCGGAFRTFPTADGWFGLSLARVDDLRALPALVQTEVHEPWTSAQAWAEQISAAEASARAELFGMAYASSAGPTRGSRPAVIRETLGARQVTDRPRVLDLSSLWAGPLCGNLLKLCGVQVTKLESTSRPDGARHGSQQFFDVLHHGKDFVSLDIDDSAGLKELRKQIREADLVIDSSRPRALRSRGILAEEAVAAGTSWLSITAQGRTSNAIGFGDDAAVHGGLRRQWNGEVIPCGDALADPLTGTVAAAAAAEALLSAESVLLDVSMVHLAAEAAEGPIEPHELFQDAGRWWVESDAGTFEVEDPATRASTR